MNMRTLLVFLLTLTAAQAQPLSPNLILTPNDTAWPRSMDFKALPGECRALQIFRNPPLAYPYDKSWAVATYFTQHGDLETDASITISGRHEETPDSHGCYPVRRPAKNYMLGIWSDVSAPSQVHRGNDQPGSCAYVNLDPVTGKENLRIHNDGTIAAQLVKSTAAATGSFRAGKYLVIVEGGTIKEIVKVPMRQRVAEFFKR